MEEWYQSNDGKPLRVDYYQSKTELMKYGMGHIKYYPTILSVVKVALILGHGNTEVEWFSDSSKTVTHLSKASINYELQQMD